MNTYVIIKDNEVINKVIWDGVSKWEYPFPYDEIIQSDELQIGMMKDDDGIWYIPEIPTSPKVTKEYIINKILSGETLTEEEILILQ